MPLVTSNYKNITTVTSIPYIFKFIYKFIAIFTRATLC